ncbi:MAG: 3,4-dihydroxy 2-butanone 4-phosphate synthase/GTP cyclohydrolase II [Verrucomicrobiales bacterium]|jgi:3,4-dihydroxy 2-butanone 4-phosphate synthase/GTP cyclohydrolase II
MDSNAFSPIPEVIADIAAGRIVIVTDDEDRENEGDLIAAASTITPEIVNFMATHGRGLICAPISEARAKALELPIMVPRNEESFKTNYTVSVDAAEGVTTGISTHDRARTISILADANAKPSDLVRPGHVFPLQAKAGGVLERNGHTEAAIDLTELAGLPAAAVVCEISNADGTMARMPQLIEFAKLHGLKLCTIEALIEYRQAENSG